MATADFRFYGELNHFLPPRKRQVSFPHAFEAHPSIKDMIESLGVPHPEVCLILVNGKSVNFSYSVKDADQISVYPVVEAAEVTHTHDTPLVSLKPESLAIPRFVLDIHLGKLATSLRMLGFDTLYRNDYGDEELAEISSTQKRILLTRDRGLLMRSIVTYGYYVRETNPRRQIVEVLQHFDLFRSVNPFQRCLRCNGILEPISKESVLNQIPPNIQRDIEVFHRCIECSQVYWRGSHSEQMQQFIEQILNSQV
jgi:uncharacterized protein with PIN domain